MTKLTAPLMSLDASGSVDQTITYRRRRTQAEAIAIPTHPDALTEKQLAHRTIYAQASLEWQLMTTAQKAAYTAAAKYKNLTPWNLFLSFWLTQNHQQHTRLLLTNNAITSGQARDFSGYNNHATLTGMSITPGYIAHGLLSDGINDVANCGNSASINPTAQITIELAVKATIWQNVGTFAPRLARRAGAYELVVDTGELNKLDFRILQGGVTKYMLSLTPVPTAAWCHIICTHNGTTSLIYFNGILNRSATRAGPIDLSANNTYIACRDAAEGTLNGAWDEVRIYDTALTATQVSDQFNRLAHLRTE